VPLRRNEVLLGVITAFRQEVRPFSDEQIALLQNFAAQAVIAMENARLLTETREALVQQTATAEILQVINSSPGDRTPVFEAILEKVRILCGATHGSLSLSDGGRFRMVAINAQSQELSNRIWRMRQEFLLSDFPHLKPLLDGARLVHVPDLLEFGNPFGARTGLFVALRKDDALLGVIATIRHEIRPFSDKEIALVENFAAQAVIAMENARLLGELRQRTTDLEQSLEYQTATSDVLQVVSRSTFDLQPVLDTLIGTAARLCHAELGHIAIRDGDVYRPLATFAISPERDAYMRTLEFKADNTTVVGRTVSERKVIHVADVQTDAAYASSPGVVSSYGLRTGLGAPLLRQGEPIGAIMLGRLRVDPFTERQIKLVGTFADQAVIAIENTRLITETREALEQQTATAEVLQVINSSPGDLAPVFESILEKAHSLCDASYGALWSFDGESFRAIALHSVPQGYAEFITGRPFQYAPGRRSGIAQIADGADFAHFLDVAADQDFQDAPGSRAVVELGGARTMLVVALRREGTLLGAITAYRKEVQPFTCKQIALLQNFAAQAVIAMENARLLTETREALEQQTATAEVLQVINSSPGDLASVFDTMLEKAMHLCEAAFGMMHTYDGKNVRPVAVRGIPPRFAKFAADPSNQPGPGGATPRLAAGARFVHVADLMEEEAYRSGEPYRRALVDLGGARTLLVVPLRKDGVMLGQIAIYRTEARPYTDKQVTLLQNFAAQAVIAMENARLIIETREALEQQTATAEVLQVINSSPGDLAPVFDAMLDKAVQLCAAAHGSLRIFDGEAFHLAATDVGERFAVRAHRLGPIVPYSGHPMAPLTRGEPFVQLEDARDTAAYHSDAALRQRVDDARIRSWLAVALRKNEMLLGAILLHREEVRPFSSKEIALLQNFAAQAVIAMENARLLTETREALEQQTATAEVLGVINSSPSDLTPVFDAMLEKALRLCEAGFGTLLTWDGECFNRVASRGLSPELILPLGQRQKPAPGSVAERFVLGQNIIAIPDLTEDAAYRSSRALQTIRCVGMRSYVSVALRMDAQLLGYIAIFRREVRPFTEKQIALQNFAAQAVIAMENARLLTETREALEQQTATAEVLQVINPSPGDLTPVFDAILQKAHSLCGAENGGLALYDGEKIRTVAAHAYSNAFLERAREGFPASGHPVVQPLLDGAQFVHIPDLAEFNHPVAREVFESTGVRTVLGVPLRRDNALLGVITSVRREIRLFTDKQIALLQNFAAQAVIAMENGRLLGELRQRTEEVSELNRGLETRVAEQVEELGRVGRLKRFLAPQLAELIVSQGDEKILESHRREIVVVF